jgi:hypothetical protein
VGQERVAFVTLPTRHGKAKHLSVCGLFFAGGLLLGILATCLPLSGCVGCVAAPAGRRALATRSVV